MQPHSLIDIDFRRCGKTLLHHIGILVAALLVGAVAGGGIGYFVLDREDIYDARASVFSPGTNIYGQAPESVQYADVAKSLKVSERAAMLLGDDRLDMATIYSMVQVEYEDTPYATNSAVINIHAKSTDPDEAVRVANAVAEAFVAEVTGLTGEDNVKMLDKALMAGKSYNANKQLLITAGLAGGGCFAVVAGFLVLLEIFSFRLHTVRDGTLNGQLPLLGVVPQYDNTPPSPPQPKARATRRS